MRVKRITDAIGLKVYTDNGDFFGEVEEANLQENKIDGWRIKVGGSAVALIGGARGVIIPHQYVRAVSDIFIINSATLPSASDADMGVDIEEVPEELI